MEDVPDGDDDAVGDDPTPLPGSASGDVVDDRAVVQDEAGPAAGGGADARASTRAGGAVAPGGSVEVSFDLLVNTAYSTRTFVTPPSGARITGVRATCDVGTPTSSSVNSSGQGVIHQSCSAGPRGHVTFAVDASVPAGTRLQASVSHRNGATGGVTGTASLTIDVQNPEPRIDRGPDDVTVHEGQTATFSATVSDTVAPVEWQTSADGSTGWTTVGDSGTPGSGTHTVSFTTGTLGRDDGRYYRVRTGLSAGGSAMTASAPALLTVLGRPAIDTQPQDVTVRVGERAPFSVVARDVDSYRWQWSSDDGTTWASTSENASAATADFTTTARELAHSGLLYRVRLTNAVGETYSDPARLTVVDPPVVTGGPEDQAVLEGQDATFAVTVFSGTPDPTFRWQVSQDGGASWSDLGPASADASVVVRAVTPRMDGWLYRAVLSNGVGDDATSRSARLGVTALPTITAPVGDQAAGTVVYTGTGPVGATIRWYDRVLGGNGQTGTVVVGTGGTWEFTRSKAAGDTVWELVVELSGRPDSAVATTYRVLELPTITAPVGDQPAGTVVYSGTGPAGATLRWTDRRQGAAAAPSGTVVVGSDGTWRFTQSKAASDTVWELTVQVLGVSGSGISTTYRVREADAIVILTPGSGSVHEPGTVTLTGTAHPSSRLRPTVSGTDSPVIAVAADGRWTTTVSLDPGRHTVAFRYEELQGATVSVDLRVHDPAVVVAEVGGAAAAEGMRVTPSAQGSFPVTGTGFPGREVQVDVITTGNGSSGDTRVAIVADDGRWSVTMSGELESLRWRDVHVVAREVGGAEQDRVRDLVLLWPITIAAPVDHAIVGVGADLTVQARGFSWVEHEVLVDGEVVRTVQTGRSPDLSTILDADVLRPGARTLTVRQTDLPEHSTSVVVHVLEIAGVSLTVTPRVVRVDSLAELRALRP